MENPILTLKPSLVNDILPIFFKNLFKLLKIAIPVFIIAYNMIYFGIVQYEYSSLYF